ncbi:major facilitator superfamily domain-containing protein [Ditylenchus destructor]|nr:major facilitator superfamily domain-containing protein [Ditylenchus destructor]
MKSTNGITNGLPSNAHNFASATEEKKTQWASIYLASSLTFMAGSQYTMYFLSLWPHLRIIDPTATETFFGLMIASYSLSQSISAPLLGYCSNRTQRFKPFLILCIFFMFAGNLLYFCAELFPARIGPKYVLMASRVICGVGDSAYSMLTAYAASSSLPQDRSRSIAFVTGGNALGTIFGPAFQVLFTWIGYPGWYIVAGISLSMFNASALFACVTNLISVTLLIVIFKESFVGVDDSELNKESYSDRKLPPYDKRAAAVCYCMRFTQTFVITNLETIGAALSIMMFTFTPSEAVFYGSLAHVGMGLLSFSTYFFYIVSNISRRVNERLVCLASLFGLLLFHVFTFSWPFLEDDVFTYKSANMTITDPNTIVGCDLSTSPWCISLKRVNPFFYYILFVVSVGLAFPNINVTMNTLLSKIIGPRLLGTHQGIMQMSSGAARMIGPLLVGYLYTYHGPRAVWILEGIQVTLMIFVWALSYNRLVPLKWQPFSNSPTETAISIVSMTPPATDRRKSREFFIALQDGKRFSICDEYVHDVIVKL